MDVVLRTSNVCQILMLKEKYIEIRNKTVDICSHLKDEEHVIQVAEFASPPKWHLGHSTWFFETFLLKPFFKNYKVYNIEYDFLFNSYYETLGERLSRNSRGVLFRPYTPEINAYRKHVDDFIIEHFSDMNDEMKNVLELGLNHEQQHQELLITDTKYLFSMHPLLPAWDTNASLNEYKVSNEFKWLNIAEGIYSIGHTNDQFSFDNEQPAHKQYIGNFSIMDRPVTNKEYLEFIIDGGYDNFKFWLAEGWDWINREKISHPMYWKKNKDEYFFFHLDGLKKLELDLPVMHISYFEAEAYAHWKGLSLPTEFEWETAADQYPGAFRNIVWEWTQSAYLPYPGFKIAEGAIGEYNGKFMINQMVLRGGSIATPKDHSRITYRNFFHPHLQWQFSGLRLIKRT
jgi:ergothioneine biosynthesis protein EgtB